MIKNVDAAYGWAIHDTNRHYNEDESFIAADSSGAEAENTQWGIDVLSNGFKLRTAGQVWNTGNTYIYAAFASHPLKYARAR